MEKNLYNLDMEVSLLTILMQETEKLDELFITADMLSPNVHEPLLKTMLDLRAKGKSVEPLSIYERLGDKHIGRVGGVGFLTELAGGMAQSSSFDYYQDTILQYYQDRQARSIGMQLAGGADPQKAMKALAALYETKVSNDNGDIQEALRELYHEVVLQEGHGQGLLYKYKDLDNMTKGAHPGDLIIVAARPSVGKTAFALNIAENVVGSRKNPDGAIVVLFSLEMGKKLLLKRSIAMKGNMDANKMRVHETAYTEEDRKQFDRTLAMVAETDLKLFDKPADMKFITSKSREIKRKNPGREILIMVDYLQLIQGNKIHKGNKQAEVGDSSQQLKALARELECPVIALSQLSRGVEQRQDKRPMMSDLRDSGQVEQDADTIILLFREDYYDKETEDQNMIELIIAKQRNGPTGNVKLAFIKEYGKFVTIDWSGSGNVTHASQSKVTKLGHIDDEPLTD